MASNWVLTEGDHKIMEGTHAEVLSLVNEHDPFITRLKDGQKVNGLLLTKVDYQPIHRTEGEKVLRAFTASIHKEIHDAADAAYRSEYNKAESLLVVIQDRVNNFLSRHA